MKEPDTAYRNSFTRYGLLFISNSEILQAVNCSLLARYIEYMTSTKVTLLGLDKGALTVRPRESATVRLMWTPLHTDCWVADTVGVRQ